MERLKNMSLKKAFFSISFAFLLVGLVLGTGVFIFFLRLQSNLSSGEKMIIDQAAIARLESSPASSGSDWSMTVLAILQLAVPIFLVIAALFLAAVVFYRIKLKQPLHELQNAAARIQQQDLNFTVEKQAEDELGELCSSFEAMRVELLKNKQELWRQMEERKRLNAAFSHDLKNPVTVLKGAATILQKQLPPEQASAETVKLVATYAERIETYVAVMSQVQKLEELAFDPQACDLSALMTEMTQSLSILSENSRKELKIVPEKRNERIVVDRFIVQNVVENLVSNALRYGQSTVEVASHFEQGYLSVSVIDDGPGFPDTLINKGPQPFFRGDKTEGDHFGMGLYVCQLLCQKHGGELTIKNSAKGTVATASFFVQNVEGFLRF